MDQTYWLDRKRAALGMAGAATTSVARLIHFDLAGRYAVMAARKGQARRRPAGGEQ